MNNCTQCGRETTNPKFCSRSCSASFTGAASPKRRLVERFCPKCSTSLGIIHSDDVRLCSKCKRPSTERWESVTLGMAKSTGNANAGSRYPYIRRLARDKWIKSGMPMRCEICGYELHIEVCHIVDVRKFSLDTLISVVNNLDNMVPLCKNHHWEFDNGHLSVRGILKV
jgi:hypothetical protein